MISELAPKAVKFAEYAKFEEIDGVNSKCFTIILPSDDSLAAPSTLTIQINRK